jgi:pyruvate dehydrogenase E1 component alpha subunit
LLVTECYRIEGHYAGEPEVYRSKSEVEEQRKKDPIKRFGAHLVAHALASEADLAQIDAASRQEMVEAVQYARESPPPDPATAMDYIYA